MQTRASKTLQLDGQAVTITVFGGTWGKARRYTATITDAAGATLDTIELDGEYADPQAALAAALAECEVVA